MEKIQRPTQLQTPSIDFSKPRLVQITVTDVGACMPLQPKVRGNNNNSVHHFVCYMWACISVQYFGKILDLFEMCSLPVHQCMCISKFIIISLITFSTHCTD